MKNQGRVIFWTQIAQKYLKAIFADKYKLINPSTYQPQHLPFNVYHLTPNLSTHQLINPSTHQPINLIVLPSSIMASPINDPCFLQSFVFTKLYSSEILGLLSEEWKVKSEKRQRLRRRFKNERLYVLDAVYPSTGSGTGVDIWFLLKTFNKNQTFPRFRGFTISGQEAGIWISIYTARPLF